MQKKVCLILIIGIIITLSTGCGFDRAEPTYTDSIIRGAAGGEYVVPEIDESTSALITIEYEHHEIHDGNTYTVMEVSDIGNGAVRDILVVSPSILAAHLVWEIEHELETSIQFYTGTTYSDNGTAIASFNRDGNSTNTATTMVYHTPTIADEGMLVATIQQGDGKKAGGSDRQANEFILKLDTAYLIRITNLTVDGNLIFMKLNWYERAL